MNTKLCKLCQMNYTGEYCHCLDGIKANYEPLTAEQAKRARKISRRMGSVNLLEPYINHAPKTYGKCVVCTHAIDKDHQSMHYRSDGRKEHISCMWKVTK